jgi:hypothetical protein
MQDKYIGKPKLGLVMTFIAKWHGELFGTSKLNHLLFIEPCLLATTTHFTWIYGTLMLEVAYPLCTR